MEAVRGFLILVYMYSVNQMVVAQRYRSRSRYRGVFSVGDECSNCDRYAVCLPDRRGENTCQCRPGFTGDGYTCTRIDVCGECHRNARCELNDDTSDYECRCERGFRGDGRQCERVDCREYPGMCAREGGLCWNDVRTNVSICRCNYGYRGDGFTCEELTCDVYNDCDKEHGKCVMVDDVFRCQCDQGYTGDGKRCRLDNGEPSRERYGCEGHNDCDVNAMCVQNPRDRRQYVCRCRQGFQGDGQTCTRASNVVPCNQVNNCDQHAECMYDRDARSYRCACGRGYEGDGLTCRRKQVPDCRRPEYACAENADCEPGSGDTYVCVCKRGYRGDGTFCSPEVEEGNYLIYAQGMKLMTVNTQKNGGYGMQILYKPDMTAVAVTTDCATGDVYWTDISHGAIMTAKADGTGVQTLVTGLMSPEGIAVDHSGRNMYFTDSRSLQVSNLDGSHRKTLVNTDLRDARAVVLDIRKGVVYWIDWNRDKPQIERINMDGTERSVLVNEDIRVPNGLAFDPYSQTLCWGDAGKKTIECINSEGQGRRQVYDQANYPFDLTMLNNKLYWTDWQKRDIPNINMNGDQPNDDIPQALGGNGKKYGITAVRETCPQEHNSCSLSNGGCKFLCLPTPRGGRTCACPDGVDPRLCQN